METTVSDTSTASLLNVVEAAKALRISRAKLYQLMTAGEVESVKIGRRRLVKSEAVEAYIKSLKPADPPGTVTERRAS